MDESSIAIPAPLGLQEFDRAKGKSTCIVCSKNIAVGAYRFSYRLKRGNKFGYELKVHAAPSCMAKLNSGARAATRKTDLWYCRAAQQFTDDAGEQRMLELARDAIKSKKGRPSL